MTGPGEPELVARAAVAAGLGAALGVERALHGKESGSRTLCLVALGACAFALAGYGFDVPGSGTRSDPSRIAAQVASGIGFLGAGVIFVAGGSRVRGMTSAADIWVVAGIGILCGAGLLITASAVAGIDLAVVVLLRPLAFWLRRRHPLRGDDGNRADDD